jgi:hypothetical protein
MKYEVVEKATGARMSRSKGAPELMGSTLFDSFEQAWAWIDQVGLDHRTHEVRQAAASD